MTEGRLSASRKRLMSAAAVAALAIPLLAVLPTAQNAQAYSDILVNLDCPSFAGKLEKVSCKLTVAGGPAGDTGGNYSYKLEIIADNSTGSLVSPSSGSSATGVFNVTVTMPGEAPQTIKLRANVTSKDLVSGDSREKVKDFEVKVVDPIIITATVYNTGDVGARNVSAKFYADGVYLGERIFDVAAGASATLTYNWTWLNVASGKHVVTVVLDDEEGIVEFSTGNNVYSMTVYVGDKSNPLGGVLTIGVIVLSVLVFLTYLQKPAPKKK
ncbi:MAG: hypothetical protein JSV90_00670 [Methanobacteriota archaeon]|nr:MAG: hypothetical protein JSV90_00670 [Euryarchaeota archaeon]